MLEEFQIRPIPLQYDASKEELRAFLRRHELALEDDVEAAFGIFNSHDELSGCGCAAGSLLKCFAVSSELRGQNALGLLLSALVQDRFLAGLYDLFVITRAHNETLFANCGFFPVARTSALVMLENRPDGPEHYAAPFAQAGDEKKSVGAIVMNCNPFTLGHRTLVEYAAAHCDVLHLFVVEENRSCFPTQLRFQMVAEGTADLPNVRVHLSGPYIISSATFPTYFLKRGEDAAVLQSELDITLYRDDLSTVADAPVLNRTDISFPIAGKTVVLVDDVIYTCRTARAALDAVMQLGRPARIQLFSLIDRGHSELPIKANYVGKNIPTSKSEVVAVRLQETDGENSVCILERG